MANVVVTSTTNCIKFNYGVYATATGEILEEIVSKDDVHFYLTYNDASVLIKEGDGFTEEFTFDGANNTRIIDSVNGVAPTSNSDLYSKLATLKG